MKLPAESPSERDCRDIYRRPLIDRVVDYSEYMWMGEEMEEFDRKCLEQILEDDFIESCIEEMLEEEDQVYDYIQFVIDELLDTDPGAILAHLQEFARSNNIELEFLQDPTLRRHPHKLNPEAPEFVPGLRNNHRSVLPSDGIYDR